MVQLGNPAQVKAPYPRVTLVPPAALTQASGLVLHGFLTQQGTFRELQAVGRDQASGAAEIIATLRQWEFRPAVRDGVPIEIEVVITVPGSRG